MDTELYGVIVRHTLAYFHLLPTVCKIVKEPIQLNALPEMPNHNEIINDQWYQTQSKDQAK